LDCIPEKDVIDTPSERENPEEAAIQKDLVAYLMCGLSHKEIFVLERRYGLGGEPALTQTEIASDAGVSPSRISQLEIRALRKMKHMSSLRPVDLGGVLPRKVYIRAHMMAERDQ
jgi:DNA-directed RNA polymerase sigma subunit (sigma70/sigma32)